eukprot:m.336466 g.336466  ORF g.336466 m.336466 type:complete len:212 (+) comp55697_c0_seq2:64-699(+)
MLRALLVVCAVWCVGVSGLYFHIKESETKCFSEELPDETVVVGNYRCVAQNEDGTFSDEVVGIHVEVSDPQGNVIMAKDYEDQGRFAFNSHAAGEHYICMHTNSTRWFGGRTVRVYFDIRIGEASNDYDTIAEKEHLTTVETRLYQLIAQVKQIANEQSYQRTREANFRELSESTNARVLWWSIAQALILVIAGFWQLSHLKSFFEAKKLV